MAQPFLPPPPSSTRRRQRRVSIETSAVVQQRHSPATQRPVESSAFPGPSRLVDFDCPAADPTASTEQLQTWTPQQSGQSSLFDATAVSSQPTSSNFSSYSQLQAASPQAPLVQTDGFTFQQLEFTEQTIQHPVQFGDFPPQLASLSPAVAPPAATLEWGGLSQAADASVTGNEPDDIDFQISQMEQELAQLDALSVQYEGDDYEDVVPDFRAIGTQEQKVNQTSQTAIYDFPRLPPPPCTGRKTSQVDPFDINQYSQSQQAPVVLDFDNVFPIGNSGAVSQAPFPPQPPTSEGESQYADVSEIRQRKSAKGGQRSTKANPLQVTHRAVHDFKARHDDEIDLDKGVPVTVEATAKDGWCTGVPELPRFPVKFLGTVPLKTHIGMKYLSAAISKVVAARQKGSAPPPPPVLQVLEVSEQGLRLYFTDKGVIDNSKRPNYFPLEKVTYVGAHPQHRKYFGFICESPSREGMYLCSVFVYGFDARPICEAVSQVFKKLKGSFLNHSNPTYDFYAE